MPLNAIVKIEHDTWVIYCLHIFLTLDIGLFVRAYPFDLQQSVWLIKHRAPPSTVSKAPGFLLYVCVNVLCVVRALMEAADETRDGGDRAHLEHFFQPWRLSM